MYIYSFLCYFLQPKAKLFPIEKKKKSSAGGFEFNFVKNDKVKAIVARKRPAKTLLAKKSESNESTSVNLSPKPIQKSTEKPKQSPKLIQKKPDADIDSLLNIAKVKQPEDEASLSLNINTSIDLSKVPHGKLPFGEKKKRLSRYERKEKVLQRRINVAKEKKMSNPFKNEKLSQNVTQQKSQTANKVVKKAENIFKNTPEVPVVGQRFVKPINEVNKMSTFFSLLSLKAK